MPRGFLQHVADVDDQQAKITGHVVPGFVLAHHLKAGLGRGGQNRQQVDVAMRGGPQRTRVLQARQRRVMQHAQQSLLAPFDHVGQRHRITGLDIGRRVVFDPLQQLRCKAAARSVIASGCVGHFGWVAAPRKDVKKLFQIALRVVFGGFGDGG